jgi:predicted nucleotidyltransferase
VIRSAPGDDERARVAAVLDANLAARPEIRFACLHGSFARGEPYRDIDVAVWVDSTRVPPEARVRYMLDLAIDLEAALGQRVDLQILNDAPLAFRYHALAGPALTVRDRDEFDDLRARTWDEYFDFLPFARQYLREVLGA